MLQAGWDGAVSARGGQAAIGDDPDRHPAACGPMAGSNPAAGALHADLRELTWDIACARGALYEIATCWRRSLPTMPDLPLRLPLRLQDAARQIEADARFLAAAGPGHAAGLAADVAGRFDSFRHDIASAQALTRVPGSAGIGDELLWDSVADALNRAGSRLLSLLALNAAVTGWPLATAASRPASGQ